MSTKLAKSTFPSGHGPNDFQAFGPPATENGQFDNCKIADMVSFSQEEKDSNKMYHMAVVKSKINGKWYVYFEWGRVGATKTTFQIIECGSEEEAQKEFADQCHEKNDKRGVWTTIAGIKTLTAKPKKDVYLVRQLVTRNTGLPDAKTIKYVDPNVKEVVKVKKTKSSLKIDPYTSTLLQDLIGGTIKYTRSSMADSSLPTQTAINQGRSIISEANKRLSVVGNNIKDQIADKELRSYSSELYRRIPKIKAVGTPDEVWILSQNNILQWLQDLDAYESALTGETQIEEKDSDPFCGLPLTMEWLDTKEKLGKFIANWWIGATQNRHGGIGKMQIKNLWRVDRHGDDERFYKEQDSIFKDMNGKQATETAIKQPEIREDVNTDRRNIFSGSNTTLLFHGSRSINVKGILEKSFVLPEQLSGVTITGSMYGAGLYWSDDWKKSAGYTSMPGSYWANGGGGIKGRSAFMFVSDVVLGEPHIAPGAKCYMGPPKGTHSVFGMGRNHPNLKKYPGFYGSGVENNEWIIFKTAQCRLKYLAEFTT